MAWVWGWPGCGVGFQGSQDGEPWIGWLLFIELPDQVLDKSEKPTPSLLSPIQIPVLSSSLSLLLVPFNF